ncbi:MAG: hypothetical protein GY851_16460 [bacterium]|nr:hypothetical protein [bacterium]
MDLGRPLNAHQIAEIHEAAECLIESTGFVVQDSEALDTCQSVGAKVDEAQGRVRIPRTLLRELLDRAPATYTIGGVSGATHEIGGGTPWGVAIVTDPWIVDYETQRPRRPRLDDLRRHTILAQKLEPVAAVARMDFPVEDVPGVGSSLRAWEEHLLHHGKHCYFVPAETDSNRQWRDIVAILAGDEDPASLRLFSIMVAVISPLTISSINVDLMRMAFEYGAPIVPTICPMAGSTSPYTIASTLLQGHAENLSMMALSQMLKPGHPFLYAFGPSVTDLRTGHDQYYTLDKVLWKSAAVQLAKSCGLPATAECGGAMTYRYDAQTGMEGNLFMLAAAGSGAHVLAGFGSCYTAMGMSAEMMVIQEAWLDAARFLQRGIRTEDGRLGLDRIEEAGPGGAFMTDPLTLEYMHGDEFFDNGLFDVSPCGHDGKSMIERAHERVEELIAGFESPVPGNVQEGLRRYFHDERLRIERGSA